MTFAAAGRASLRAGRRSGRATPPLSTPPRQRHHTITIGRGPIRPNRNSASTKPTTSVAWLHRRDRLRQQLGEYPLHALTAGSSKPSRWRVTLVARKGRSRGAGCRRRPAMPHRLPASPSRGMDRNRFQPSPAQTVLLCEQRIHLRPEISRGGTVASVQSGLEAAGSTSIRHGD